MNLLVKPAYSIVSFEGMKMDEVPWPTCAGAGDGLVMSSPPPCRTTSCEATGVAILGALCEVRPAAPGPLVHQAAVVVVLQADNRSLEIIVRYNI